MTLLLAAAPIAVKDMVRRTTPPRHYVPLPHSGHAWYQVCLPAPHAFAGPADLLLLLVKEQQLPVAALPLADLCTAYAAQVASLAGTPSAACFDVAADLLETFATLLWRKAADLLPQPETADPEEDADAALDAAALQAQLAQRLRTYRAFQDAAQQLAQRAWLERDVFARHAEVFAAQPAATELPPLRPGNAFALVQALHGVLKRQRPPGCHQVALDTNVSLQQRMHQVASWLAASPSCSLSSLLARRLATEEEASTGRLAMLINFLAILELARMKLLRLLEDAMGALRLEARFAHAEEAHTLLAQQASTLA